MEESRAVSNSRGWVWAHTRFTYLPEGPSAETVSAAEPKIDLRPVPVRSSIEIFDRPVLPQVLGTGGDGGSTNYEEHRLPRHSRSEFLKERSGKLTDTGVRVPSSFKDRGAAAARRKLRAAFIKSTGITMLCGTLLALVFYYNEQGARNSRAATALVPSAIGLCNALSSFAILPIERRMDSEPEGEVACRSLSPGSERGAWQSSDISVTVFGSPTDPKLLRDVVLEGPNWTGARGTAAKRQLIWASSVIFTQLGMEIPWKIAEAVEHGSRAELSERDLNITAGPRCRDTNGKTNESCRMVIEIRNRPNLHSSFPPL